MTNIVNYLLTLHPPKKVDNTKNGQKVIKIKDKVDNQKVPIKTTKNFLLWLMI